MQKWVIATLRVNSLWRRQWSSPECEVQNPAIILCAAQTTSGISKTIPAAHQKRFCADRYGSAPVPRRAPLEATGGRINLKLGQEDAVLADGCRLRSVAAITQGVAPHASRQADKNRLEHRQSGHSVDRGSTAARCAHLRCAGRSAPHGGTTRRGARPTGYVSGNDRGWHGTAPTSGLQGPLGSAALKAKTTLVDLRRADFVPARSLDESISCASSIDLPAVQLTNLACTMPGRQSSEPPESCSAVGPHGSADFTGELAGTETSAGGSSAGYDSSRHAFRRSRMCRARSMSVLCILRRPP